jgi:hypothetical protein
MVLSIVQGTDYYLENFPKKELNQAFILAFLYQQQQWVITQLLRESISIKKVSNK